MRNSLFFLVAFFCCCTALFSEETVLELQGYIGPDQLASLEERVDDFEGEALYLRISSDGGDLTAVLAFGAKLYEWKAEGERELIVQIEKQAVGPAALLPLMADKVYSSMVVTWGALSLGSEATLPVNLLRSQVTGLIPSDHPKRDLVLLLAEAMCDPALVVEKEGDRWVLHRTESSEGTVLSPTGETLVLHYNQMQELGLVSAGVGVEVVAQQEEELASLMALPELEEYIYYSEEEPNYIGRIYIGGHDVGIDQSTWIYVNAALKHFREEVRPIFLLVEIDSPGGEVFSSQQISDALYDFDRIDNIPCVALVDNWAISAGAMITYSCRFIVVSSDASMGAAAPVFQGGETGIVEAPEKINSALRADFANRAQFFGRNPDIAEAMVDDDVILVQRHGKVVRLQSMDEVITSGLHPDTIISKEGKLLTLNAKQMKDLAVADIVLGEERVEGPTPKELAAGRWPAERSPLMQDPFFGAIPYAVILSYQMSWQTAFFAFLAKPAVASLLMLGLMIGFYLEINSPGVGLPGIVGITCLALILLSSFSAEAVHWLEVIILVVGLVLIALEMFVIPGFGIAGILGIFMSIGGLFAMMLPALDKVEIEWSTQTWNAAGEAVLERLAWLSGTFVVGLILIALMARYLLPTMPFFQRLVLQGEQEKADGYVAGVTEKELPPVGAEGITLCPLRPAGKVEIGGVIYDVVSSGPFVLQEKKVQVVRIEGGHLFVEELHE